MATYPLFIRNQKDHALQTRANYVGNFSKKRDIENYQMFLDYQMQVNIITSTTEMNLC